MRIGPVFRLRSKAAIVAVAAALLAATAALGAGPDPAPPAGTDAAKATQEPVTLNFVNAEIEAVVRAIGQYTGRTFVIDPRVKGTMTLVTERPVTRQQAYEELQSALRLQGFTLVESPDAGGVTRVLLEADAKLQGGRVLAPAAPTPRGDQIVTQVFRLQYESASNLVPVLRPLIAPNNTIAAYAANNTLVITDYAENLRRLARIIEAIDSPANAEVIVVPMKYAQASDIANIVNHVLDEGARASGQGVDSGQRVLVQAEPRSNSLILRAASAARLQQARSLIEHFDQPSATPGNINVIYLRNAQAIKLAPLLRAVLSSDPSFVAQAGGTTGLAPAGYSGTGVSATGAVSGTAGTSTLGGLGSSTLSAPGSSTAPSPASASAPPSGGGGGGGDRTLAGMIQADPATNSLIISAPEPVYRNIRAIVDKLDVRPAQVLIESLVVSIAGDKAAQFGIQWQALSGLNSSSTSVVGGTNFGNSSQNIISAATNLTNLGAGINLGVVRGTVTIPGVGTVTNLGVLASALETVANATILSRPNIQTLDNEEGKFLVGQNVPFVSGSYAATGTTTTTSGSTVTPFQTYERQDIGLQLRVKPQISEGGSIRMGIYIEQSSVSPGTSGTDLILNKRSFETSVIVDDGNFVVISGMIEDTVNENQYKVPLLGDIPLLGYLFRYDTREHIKTQTMVFLRPTVIRDEPASQSLVMDRYEYIRAALAKSSPQNHPPLPDVPTTGWLPPLSGKQEPEPAKPGSADPHGAIDPPLVEVAVVDTMEQARKIQGQLKDAGLDAYCESFDGPGGAHVRVRLSAQPAKRPLEQDLAQLRALGYSPTLVSTAQAASP